MSHNIIRAFDPFNLKHGSSNEDHIYIQEVIYYGESRFRQALAEMTKADPCHQMWMQSVLQIEVVRNFRRMLCRSFNEFTDLHHELYWNRNLTRFGC